MLECLRHGYGVVAVALAVGYQAMLQYGGLESYVLYGPRGDGSRVGVVSANREGIVSCLGYLALYMGWIQCGRWLLKPRLEKLGISCLMLSLTLSLSLSLSKEGSEGFFRSSAMDGAGVCCAVAGHELEPRLPPAHLQATGKHLLHSMDGKSTTQRIMIICKTPSLPPFLLSRQFSYGALILSTSLAIDLVVLLLADTSHSPRPPPYAPVPMTTTKTMKKVPPRPPCVCSAIDANQLAVFLLANVLTGLVNFGVDTLHASAGAALLILAAYMAILTAAFMVLHRHNVKIKL